MKSLILAIALNLKTNQQRLLTSRLVNGNRNRGQVLKYQFLPLLITLLIFV